MAVTIRSRSRPNLHILGPIEENQWSCDACTLMNSMFVKECEACGLSRRNVPDVEFIQEIKKNVGQGSTEMSIGSKDMARDKTFPGIGDTSDMEKRCRRRAFRELLHASRTSANAVDPSATSIQAVLDHIDTLKPSWNCQVCTFRSYDVNAMSCEVCGIKRILDPAAEKKALDRRKSNDPRGPVKDSVIMTYSEILKTCKLANIPFVDDSFPPAPKSLYFNGVSSQTKKRIYDANSGQVNAARWLRPEEIYGDTSRGKWTVIKNPSPSDIIQGRLGNCWFISALALIAEREELLENIVKIKEVNSTGVYIIRLCKDGRWTDVIIDDLFPCDQLNRQIYSKGKRKQLWVPLIEKAMAKLHGCYESLVSGFVSEALMTLTGFPCDVIRLDVDTLDVDMTWATLMSFQSVGFLMGAASGDVSKGITDEEYLDHGLIRNHEYSVLQIVNEQGHRLIQLRNPWGRGSWNGNWSDKSTLWTAEMKDKLKPQKNKDGVFWMCFVDFLKYFYVLEVCKIRKDWKLTNFQGIFTPYADPKHHPIYTISISHPTELDITIYQSSKRELKGQAERPVPGDLMLLLFAAESDTLKEDSIKRSRLVGQSERKRANVVQLNCIVDPGEYYVIPFSLGHWTDDDHEATYPTFEISIYSSRKIKCSKPLISPSHFLLADAIIALGLANCDRMESENGLVLYSHGHRKFGNGCIYIAENPHKDKWIAVQLDLSGSMSVICSRGTMKTQDCIPPRSRQVINFLTSKNLSKHSYSCSKVSQASRSVNVSVFGSTNMGLHNPELHPSNYGLHSPRPI